MNMIGKITVNFTMQNEAFARELYARWDPFFTSELQVIAGDILSGYDTKDEIIEIEKLELDLGGIFEQDFDEQFPQRFREQLENALLHCLHESSRQERVMKIPEERFLFELLSQFLLSGTLPWNTPAEYKNIPYLFDVVLQRQSKELKQFLHTYGHYTSLQQRLVYQLQDPGLEKGVSLLEPSNAAFICSYVRLLHARYNDIPEAEIEEGAHHDAVWLVVYAYLLNNRSSYFNKKTFLAHTILQLANTNNLSYSKLLEAVTYDLENFSTRLVIPAELFKILGELQKELSEEQLSRSVYDAANYYRFISGLLQKEISKGIHEQTRENLIAILSRADSCRVFLQQLTDPEIIALVPVVMPDRNDSDFVIHTARLLDKAGKGGIKVKAGESSAFPASGSQSPVQKLQGKSGGEFRLVKWQVIFPLLLANQGATLNRRYFVQNILKQVAAHYNMDFRDLLFYIYQDIRFVDASLAKVLEEIYQVGIKTGEREDISHWEQKVENSPGSEKPEDEIGSFSALDFIDSLENLDLSHRNFVEQILQNMAVHYNLAYPDLLLYLQSEDAVTDLPFGLQVALAVLSGEEKEHWAGMILRVSKESEKFDLLEILFPEEHPFIKTYVEALDKGCDKGKWQGKTSGDFGQVKWKFIFEVLFESRHLAFNKKHFVRQTLCKLAAHYNMAFHELLSYVSGEVQRLPYSSFSTIQDILAELYSEEAEERKIDETIVSTATVVKIKAQFVKTFGKLTEKETVLLEKLAVHPVFVSQLTPLLACITQLKKYFADVLKVYMDNQSLIEFLWQLIAVSGVTSRTNIVGKILEWAVKSLTVTQKEWLFDAIEIGKWETGSIEKILLHQLTKREGFQLKNKEEIIAINHNQLKTQEMEKSENTSEPFKTEKTDSSISDSGSQFIANAGMVLLSPYLPRLFSMLELTEKNQFKDDAARTRAIFLIQFAVFGKTEFPEHEMTFTKLLTGFEPGLALPGKLELKPEEKETVETMLKGVLQNWPKLKNTSMEGLRQAFLQREGKLEEKEDFYQLTVEEKAYDLLLDSCPWNFRTIRYPWMKKRLQVKWR